MVSGCICRLRLLLFMVLRKLKWIGNLVLKWEKVFGLSRLIGWLNIRFSVGILIMLFFFLSRREFFLGM